MPNADMSKITRLLKELHEEFGIAIRENDRLHQIVENAKNTFINLTKPEKHQAIPKKKKNKQKVPAKVTPPPSDETSNKNGKEVVTKAGKRYYSPETRAKFAENARRMHARGILGRRKQPSNGSGRESET